MAANESTYYYNITASGGTKSFNVGLGYTRIIIAATTSPTLAAAMIFNHTGTPIEGDIFKIEYLGGVASSVSGGKYVSFFGQELTDKQALYRCSIIAIYSGGAWNVHVVPSMGLYQTFGTVPGYCIEDLTASDTIFPNDKIRSQKLNVASMDGYITSAMLSTSVATELLIVDVSFESGELGDFKIELPYNCTVLGFYSFATKAIAGTDNGTITPKNNAGTTMAGGIITYTASDPRGTAYSSTPSTNNTFAAGDSLILTTAKTTAGGKIQMSIKIQRT